MTEQFTDRQDVTEEIVAHVERVQAGGEPALITMNGLHLVAAEDIEVTQYHSHIDCQGPSEWTTQHKIRDAAVRSLTVERGWGSGVAAQVTTESGSLTLKPDATKPGQEFAGWPRFVLDGTEETPPDESFDQAMKDALRQRVHRHKLSAAELADNGLYDVATQELVVSSADPLRRPHVVMNRRRGSDIQALTDFGVGWLSFYTADQQTHVAVRGAERNLEQNRQSDFLPLDEVTFRLKEVTYTPYIVRELGARLLALVELPAPRLELTEQLTRLNDALGRERFRAQAGHYGEQHQVIVADYADGRLKNIAGQTLHDIVYLDADTVQLEPDSGQPFVIDRQAGLAIILHAAELARDHFVYGYKLQRAD